MNSSPSHFTPWSGFVMGILGGFALSMGLIGLAVGYSIAGGGAGGGFAMPSAPTVADQPSVPPEPEAPSKPVRPADPKVDHIYGNANAKVSIIEYSDFECPFCKRHYTTIKEIQKKYGNDVNIVYRHFPLSFHANAAKQAEASECAAEIGGNTAFWKYHDALFERTTGGGTGFALDKLVPLAVELGMPEAKFKECLDSGKYAKKVQDQMDEGISFGVRGTPGNFVVNNATKESRELSGAVPLASFDGVIGPMLGK